MGGRKRRFDRGPLMFVTLAIAVLLIALAIVEALAGQARAADDRPWEAYLKTMDGALAAGDARTADWALRQAHWAALGSRRWEGMIEVGDAALRVGNVVAARTAYMTVAFRARRMGSFEGVVSAAEALAALGDREAATKWMAVAAELAAPSDSARARVRALAESLGGRAFTNEIER